MIRAVRWFAASMGIICCCLSAAYAQDAVTAPDFSLSDINRATVNFSDIKGKKPAVIIFWTTWCPYCREELNNLNTLYPALSEEGWEILAINVGEPLYKVANFAERYALKYKVLLDQDGKAADAYGILGVPNYFLINKNGVVVFSNSYFPQKTYRQLIGE